MAPLTRQRHVGACDRQTDGSLAPHRLGGATRSTSRAQQASATGATPALETDKPAAPRAEADALDEGLVGLVIRLGQELLAGLAARGPETFTASDGHPKPHAERVEFAREAQVLARPRAHEPALAALACVINEYTGLFRSHLATSTEGEFSPVNRLRRRLTTQ
jgi:hypothetical protein